MLKWYLIDQNSLPAPLTVKKLRIEGKSVCLVQDGNQFYALGSTCPHAGADLSQGWCDRGRLICPYHRHAFHMTDGRGDKGQGNYIHTYPLEKRGNDWYIGIPLSFIQHILRKITHLMT